MLEVGYAHHGLIIGIREVVRHAPAEFYEGRLRRVRAEVHRIAVCFLEAQKQLPTGLENIDLTADILIAICEGMTLYSRFDYTPEQLIDILAKALNQYLGTY